MDSPKASVRTLVLGYAVVSGVPERRYDAWASTHDDDHGMDEPKESWTWDHPLTREHMVGYFMAIIRTERPENLFVEPDGGLRHQISRPTLDRIKSGDLGAEDLIM